jgi:hypothetical protein
MSLIYTITKKELRDILNVSPSTLNRYLQSEILKEKIKEAGCADIKQSMILIPKVRKIVFEHFGISEEDYKEFRQARQKTRT